MEALRHAALLNMQSMLNSLCVREGLQREPYLAFQRWYFVCKMIEEQPRDPLLPSGEIACELGLQHELVEAGLAEDRAEWVCRSLAEAAAAECEHVAAHKAAYDDGAPSKGDVRISLSDYRCQVSFQCPPARAFRLHLNRNTLERLRAEYTGPLHAFESQLFCLLARYDALKGTGYQAAIPDAMFQLLSERLGVKQECFASPLNHFLPAYCSAFPDIDCFFGSAGSFFDMDSPITGSFEANPPFVEEIMAVLAEKIERWLAGSAQPLSFVVVMPGWAGTPACVKLSQSANLRCHLTFGKGGHAYKEGSHHTLARLYKIAECTTFIYIMQNEAGAGRWPVSESLKNEICTAFSPIT